MKKFLSAILILLSMTLLMADSTALTISEGNIDDVELFAPDGTSLSVLSDITESGYIIRTSGETKAFTSKFGDVYLQGDSVLAVTGFTTADPTLYLVYGTANVVMKEDLPLTFYTPTSRTAIQGEGEYAFISTDSMEAFMNYSASDAVSYDALRARTIEVQPMCELYYAEGSAVKATQHSYYATSVLDDLIVYDAVPAQEEPAITVDETEESVSIPATPVESSAESEEIPAYEETVPSEPVLSEPVVQIDETVPSEPVLSEPVVQIDETVPSEPVLSEPVVQIDETVPSEPVMTEPAIQIEEETGAVPDAPVFIGPITAIEEEEPRIPSAPVFAGTSSELVKTVPSAPMLTAPSAVLVPSSPVFTEPGAELVDVTVPSKPSVTSTATLVEEEASVQTQSVQTAEEEPLVKFGVELGASYPLNWNSVKDGNEKIDGNPLILVTPSATIGRGNWQIGLRVPLQMAFTNGPFRLAGFSGKENWNFGTDKGNTTAETIYDAITDSMTLIDHLYLGNPDSTIAYLRMESGYERNGTLFSGYGWDEGLAVRLGFNFSNLSFQVYLDNAEAPHIGEFGVSFYPFAFRGTAFSINVPTEFLFTTFDNYDVFFFPEIRLDIPFAGRSFILSAFASGTMFTSYENNELASSEIIYDFADDHMLPFLAGAQLTFDFKPVTVEISGGYRKGLSIEYFNEFTAARHEVSSKDKFQSLNGANDAFFASAALTLDFDVVEVALSYAVDDIEGFKDSAPLDTAKIRIEGHIGTVADIYASAAARNLVSSFKDFNAKDFFMGQNFLFAVGADLDFGMFGLTAEARTVYIPKSANSSYINVYGLSEESYLQFKLLGRVEF